MVSKLKHILPWMAAISALLVLVGFVAISILRQASLVDNGVTLPVVEVEIAPLQAMHPASLDVVGFLDAVKEVQNEQYVAYVWLFAPDGTIVYSSSLAAHSGTADQHATAETQRILAALPQGQLSSDQKVMLLAASAIQAEGEHNDVFRHMVRPIQAQDGGLVGLVGVAYDVSPSTGNPGILSIALLLTWLLVTTLYWLSLPLWVFIDAREREERAWVWTMFVLIGNLVALLAYILARVPQVRRSII